MFWRSKKKPIDGAIAQSSNSPELETEVSQVVGNEELTLADDAAKEEKALEDPISRNDDARDGADSIRGDNNKGSISRSVSGSPARSSRASKSGSDNGIDKRNSNSRSRSPSLDRTSNKSHKSSRASKSGSDNEIDKHNSTSRSRNPSLDRTSNKSQRSSRASKSGSDNEIGKRNSTSRSRSVSLDRASNESKTPPGMSMSGSDNEVEKHRSTSRSRSVSEDRISNKSKSDSDNAPDKQRDDDKGSISGSDGRGSVSGSEGLSPDRPSVKSRDDSGQSFDGRGNISGSEDLSPVRASGRSRSGSENDIGKTGSDEQGSSPRSGSRSPGSNRTDSKGDEDDVRSSDHSNQNSPRSGSDRSSKEKNEARLDPSQYAPSCQSQGSSSPLRREESATAIQSAWRMQQAKTEKSRLLQEKQSQEKALVSTRHAPERQVANVEAVLHKDESAVIEAVPIRSPSFLKKQATKERQLRREREKAAVIIQAHYRGRLVRKYCSMDKRKKERELRRRRQDRQFEKELIMKRLADMERRKKAGERQHALGIASADEPYQRTGYMSQDTWAKREKELASIDNKLREIEDRRMGMQARRAVQGDMPISHPKYTEVEAFAPRTRTQVSAFLGELNNIHNRPSPLASLDAYAKGGSREAVFSPSPLPTMRSRPASQPLMHRYLSQGIGDATREPPPQERPYIPSRRTPRIAENGNTSFAPAHVDRPYTLNPMFAPSYRSDRLAR